jgi:YVTN family beta-propeller protein
MTAARPPRHVAASAASRLSPPLARSRSVRTLLLGLLAGLAAVILAAPAEAASDHTAYVANNNSNSVTPIDTATNAAGAAIGVGIRPSAVAITPDGATAYVANQSSNNVTPIDTATNTAGTPIAVGTTPVGIAITPDGDTAYAANANSNNVTPIDTATNTAGTPIAAGTGPRGIAITPDGATAYVANATPNTVTPIDTATNTAGTAIAVGSNPFGVAITPDGATAYVANFASNNVTPIDTQANTAGTAIAVGTTPAGIAITPDGDTAYVANQNSNNVTPIGTATNAAGTAIAVGTGPFAVAITPDGATAYVANQSSNNVTPIDTATNTAGTAIAVGSFPRAVAITPDQAPTAAFTATPAPAGQATSFDASSSSAPPGQTVASYHWDFGDGSTQTTSSATTAHTYADAGNQTATLTVTDDAGCSTDQTFTGQTVSCNGGPQATISHRVRVKVLPTVTTSASANTTLGNPVSDTATLAGGQSPTGTILFRLYGLDNATCAGSAMFKSKVAVSGNGDYFSGNVTPARPGTYRWTAAYSGDSGNASAATACNDSAESVTVDPATPTLTTTASPGTTLGNPVSDTATLAGGHNPSGRITFRLYGRNDTTCSNSPRYSKRVAVSGNGDYGSGDFTPTRRGTYRFTASYSGDSHNAPAATACNDPGESVGVS